MDEGPNMDTYHDDPLDIANLLHGFFLLGGTFISDVKMLMKTARISQGTQDDRNVLVVDVPKHRKIQLIHKLS
jgi:hypothetical protein